MKCSFLAVLIAALALVAKTASADIIRCDFDSAAGASIKFTGAGNKIEFPSTSTYDFVINTATSPNLGGFQGNIGGTFIVETITAAGGVEQASVTTANGAFSVYDGSSNTLTAKLDWKDILVINKLIGGMNVTGITNLSDIHYTGGNSSLQQIRDGVDQAVVLSFQFSRLTKKSLTELMADGQMNSTSYSGSLSSAPEPSSCVLLGMAALGLLSYAWRRRRS